MSIIEQVFIRNIVISIIIILALILVFFLVKWAVKQTILPNWSYFVWAISTLTLSIVLSIGLFNIYQDIKGTDYITYEGIYIERGGGQKDLKTVIVYDANSREIRLLRTGKSISGEYIGTVVYGKRSKIIVEYNGVPQY